MLDQFTVIATSVIKPSQLYKRNLRHYTYSTVRTHGPDRNVQPRYSTYNADSKALLLLNTLLLTATALVMNKEVVIVGQFGRELKLSRFKGLLYVQFN